MSYTEINFVAFQVLTAANMNVLGDNDASFNDGTGIGSGAITPAKIETGTGSSWEWQDWTPTYSSLTVGNGTVKAKYIQIGKTVHFFWSITAGSTSSISSANRISLPVTPASHLQVASFYPAIGVASALDSSAGTYFIGTVFIDQNNSRVGVNVHDPTSSSVGATSSTFPISEATGDTYSLSGTYEAA